MTIRPRGNSFMVDVKVRAADNPTGKDVRVRVTASTMQDARRLEAFVRADVMRTGKWEPGRPKRRARPEPKPTLRRALLMVSPGLRTGRGPNARNERDYGAEVIQIVGPSRLCSDIRAADLDGAAAVLAKRGDGGALVKRKLRVLVRVLKFARVQGWTDARPDWDRHPAPMTPEERRARLVELLGEEPGPQ